MDAIYARQSVDKKDSISIESQIEFCKTKIPNEEYIVYADKGYSGKNTMRPKFMEMMDDIRAGKINKVIIYKLDRISRAIIDFANMIAVFDKHSVAIVSYNDPIDTSTPMGRAMITVTMVFAQLERETIQERVRDNYYARAKEGYFLGGVPPFGYDKIEVTYNNKKTYAYTQNVEYADIVRGLFYEYAHTNASLGSLNAKLCNSKIYTNKQKPWSVMAISRMLRNPVYVRADAEVYLYLKSKNATINNAVEDFAGINGCYLYGERKLSTKSRFTDISKSYVTIAPHEGLIDSETWIACQYKLDGNKQLKNTGKGTHTWLSGLLKCGYCGMSITVVNGHKSKKYITCGGRKNRVCYDRTKPYYIEEIEKNVEVELLDVMKKIMEKKLENTTHKPSLESNSLRIQLIKIEESIASLVEKVPKANDILMQYINDNISKMDSERKEILEKINAAMDKSKNTVVDFEELMSCINDWDSLSIQRKKVVAKALISDVRIYNEKIEICFKNSEEMVGGDAIPSLLL